MPAFLKNDTMVNGQMYPAGTPIEFPTRRDFINHLIRHPDNHPKIDDGNFILLVDGQTTILNVSQLDGYPNPEEMMRLFQPESDAC